MGNRVVMITGSAGGIGTALTAHFRGLGDEVIGLDLANGTDLSVPEVCEAEVSKVLQEHGRIDLLVNNAGVGAVGDVVDAPAEDWHRVFAVNVFALAHLSKAVLPGMRSRGEGAIVNTCSIAAVVGLAERAVYTASKGAVLALTQAMAADEARYGIRVNCVSPGTVEGPWVRRLIETAEDPERTADALRRRQPLGRLVEATEVAAAIAYLAEPTTYTTGQNLVLDGGIDAMRLVEDSH